MEIVKLHADPRDERGKGPAGRLRRTGKIPAVAYGNGLNSTALAISPKELMAILHSDLGRNSLIELDFGKEKFKVMLRNYAHHPVTRELVHADFYQVQLDHAVEVDVPFRHVGKSKGVVVGGVLQLIYRELRVKALPGKIPSILEIDVTNLELGESLKVSDVKVGDNVHIQLPANQTVVTCHAPEKEEAPAEGEVVADAAAAAPAAEEKK